MGIGWAAVPTMTLSSSRPPMEGHSDRRFVAAALVVMLVWLVLLARLFFLQVIEGDQYRISALRNSVRTLRVQATRGMILDRNGEILVDSRPSFDVLVVPNETNGLSDTLTRIANLVGEEPNQVLERIGRPKGRARFEVQKVAVDLDRTIFPRVQERLWALSGVVTQANPIRDYRLEQSAAHVLGRLGEIGQNQLQQKQYQGYRRGDVIGIQGIEKLLDRELRGRDGGLNVLVDAHGRQLELLDEVEPQPGQNVILTLDRRLQVLAEQKLLESERNGAVVALDPRTGEVLVLANRPAYSPNQFAKGIDSDDWKKLAEDPDTPLHNRAIHGQYPPGSTYKVVTALAGLGEGLITPDFTVECRGSFRLGRRRYRCWKRGGHKTVNLQRALAESCDVFFYQVGNEVGVDALAKYAKMLGLGGKTGIELRNESIGLVPTSEWKLRRFGEEWILGETISVAIGQGFNQWTPIQLAHAYGTIATGSRYRPFLVKRLEDPYGRPLRNTEPEELSRLALDDDVLDRVRSGLRGVVHDPHGTGYVMRRLPGGVEAAGKTGTAQVVALTDDTPTDEDEIPIPHRDHAWFVTYLPVDDPRIVIGVLVEHGGHGSSTAAPIAKAIADEFLNNEIKAAGELHVRN